MYTKLKTKGNGKNHQNQVALEAIAKKLRNGASLVEVDKALDDLLGTTLPERDLSLEGDWEHYNKGVEAGLDGK